jgi:D-3-phosphoglycerate dehydrogenase / 2-oxoglutarate reductase
MALRFLITESFHPLLQEELLKRGFTVDLHPGISAAEVNACIGNYEAIVVATRIACGRILIDHAKNLRLILRAGSGMENIDVSYASAKNILCINSPEGNANAVGEHAAALLLALFHNVVKSAGETAAGRWLVEENRTTELEGKTIGIIGYGNTGKAFARKLFGFNMKVLAYDKYLNNFSDEYATERSLNRLFEEAEIVSLHIPLTPETHHWIDASMLNHFHRAIYFINTSRGKVVQHRDLLAAIQNGKVKAAALDVYENENFALQSDEERDIFMELTKTRRVFFTPHIAGKSNEAKKKIAQVLIEKIDAWLKNSLFLH